MAAYQTLRDFIKLPFGNIPNRPEDMRLQANYTKLMKKISVSDVLEIDKMNYMVHVKIPSETNVGNYYDVVIHFFTDNKELIRERTFENYYIKFFSNSPSFTYKYAALYNINGYLIESLADKFGKDNLNILPNNTNKGMDIMYDKSIYLACRYLLDNKLSNMNKYAIMLKKTKNIEKFLEDVLDTEEISLNNSVSSFKKSVDKEIKKNDENIKKNKNKNTKTKSDITSITYAKKHKAKKNTSTSGINHISHPSKKKAVKSTVKK